MQRKVLIIILLILVVILFILIKPNFTGEMFKIELPKFFEPEEKETIEIGNKTIVFLSTNCIEGNLAFEIKNDGDVNIKKSELKLFINDEDKTDNFMNEGIDTGQTSSYSDLKTKYSGKQNIRLEGPDNTIGWGITC